MDILISYPYLSLPPTHTQEERKGNAIQAYPHKKLQFTDKLKIFYNSHFIHHNYFAILKAPLPSQHVSM